MADDADTLGVGANSKFLLCLAKFRNDPSNAEAFCGLDPVAVKEDVVLSTDIVKINRKGKRQQRSLVITSLALYNFGRGSFKAFKRRIADKVISVAGTGAQFVVHPWDQVAEYDYTFDAGNSSLRDACIQALQQSYEALVGAPLAHVTLETKLLESIIVTKAQARERAASTMSRSASRSSGSVSLLRRRESVRERMPSVVGLGDLPVIAEPPPPPGSAPTPADAPAASSTALIVDEPAPDVAAGAGDGPDVGAALVPGSLEHTIHIVVASIADASGRSPGCAPLADITSWPKDTALDASRQLAQATVHKEASAQLFQWVASVQALARDLYDGGTTLLRVNGPGDNAEARAWATRAMWHVVSRYREQSLMADVLASGGYFDGLVLSSMPSSMHADGDQLRQPQYMALLEILLGVVTLPSQGITVVEPFGKAIAVPELLNILFRVTATASWELKRDILKDMNVLLVKRESNFTYILQQTTWQSWLAPLLRDIPLVAEDRSEAQAEYLKYVMNMFAMVLFHIFSKGEDIDKVLNRFLLQLQLQCGWSEAVVGVGRSILSSLVVKIGNSSKRWRSSYERPEWNNLFKVATVVEDFIFYRPSEETSTEDIMAEESGSAVLLQLSFQFREPVADQPVAPEVVSPVDRRNVGIHLGASNEPEDLKLAQRVCSVLTKLGLSTQDGAGPNARSKAAKEVLQHGTTILKIFTDIVRFFEEGVSSDNTKMIEALGQFLEKRQRKSTGFLSKSTNKKTIVRSLQTSIMRQQAQKTIRTQVRSKVATATAAVIVEMDAGDSVSVAATGHRLRGAPADAATAESAISAAMKDLDEGVGAEESKGGGEEEAEGATASDDSLCAACEQPLLNDDGMAALGQVFHVDCFVCTHCEVPFRDKPFFERKGKAYCREDYLALFARSVCAGCMMPFRRGDAAMEALGRMWHPEHFKCTCCERVFEPEETFFDKEGMPYCGPCNERLFMTCPGCAKPVADSDDGVSALGRNWHRDCFVCTHGGCVFDGGVYYTKDAGDGRGEKPYCEAHYLDLFVPKCRACSKPVKETGVAACGSSWHADCFLCTVCEAPFPDGQFFEVDGKPYCATDYWAKYGKKCAACDGVIQEQILNALGQTWHPDCFVCTECSAPFPEMSYYDKDGKPYCEADFARLFCDQCPSCGEYVLDGGVVALDKTWHADCLVCTTCGTRLEESAHQGDDGNVYCKEHFMANFGQMCAQCGEPIEGEAISALDKQYHAGCFVCSHCSTLLTDVFRPHEGLPYCEEHFLELFGAPCHRCGEKVSPSAQLGFMDKIWHPECLTCFGPCGRQLDTTVKIFPKNGEPFCEDCFLAAATKCADCGEAIIGTFLNVLGRKYHKGCLKCFACGTTFEGKMYNRMGWPVCAAHTRGPLPEAAKEKLAAEAAEKAAQEGEAQGEAGAEAPAE